jgi:chromosomal replication initiator protein
MGVTLPEDVMNFLANRIRTNIRRLEGALIRVASYASLTGKKLTIEVVENLLREILHEEGRRPSASRSSRKRWPNILTSAWPT